MACKSRREERVFRGHQYARFTARPADSVEEVHARGAIDLGGTFPALLKDLAERARDERLLRPALARGYAQGVMFSGAVPATL